jgi:hypothetical protein
MTGFLSAVKADLLDRRLLPLVALVVAALLGAVAYAVLGGGAGEATPASVAASAPAGSSGVAISQKSSESAVAETTSGVSHQHHGSARNPFVPLVKPKAQTSTASSSTGSSSGEASSGSQGTSGSSGSGGSGSTTPPPSTPPKPSKPSKPKTVYHVAVLFGQLPAAPATEAAQLTPYESLKLSAPLPSAQQPLVVFRGVVAGGKSATFTIVSEAILHGEASCLPSASQCQAIDLREGQAEQLEYLAASGQAVVYELKVVSIVSTKASSAAVKSMMRGESKAGREALSHAGLVTLPGLRYTSRPGVLVFAAHKALSARAHASAHRGHGR